MAFNKYLIDYRTVKTEDENGHVQTRVDYIGPVFVYVNDRTGVVALAGRLLIAVVFMWAAVLGALCVPADLGHIAVSVLPLTLLVFPLYGISRCLILVRKDPEILSRQDADMLSERYPVMSLAAVALSAISLGGTVLSVIRGTGTLNSAGMLYTGLQLGALIISAVCFHKRTAFAIKEDIQE